MNYGKIKKTDIANGPGVRVSLFVSGCRNRCKGCFNRETWDFSYGERFDPFYTSYQIAEYMAPEYISGLSILGGDPLEPENVRDVISLCYMVRMLYPDKTIWLYTGYRYEDIRTRYPDVLKYIDVMVDGPFIESLKDVSLAFRGSSNQRIIDIPESLRSGKAVEVEM